MNESIISKRLYNRKSKDYGEYKVTRFLDYRGKSKIPYYEVKFKNTANVIETPEKTILENRVIDKEAKKKQTKKNNREKKKVKKTKKEWVTKYLHNPKNILVFDGATVSSGVGIILNRKIEYYNYIFTEKNKDDPNDLIRRLNYMKNNIIELINKYDIDAVVIESLPFKGSKMVLFALAQIRALILDYCYEKDIQFISISPQAWEFHSWKGRFKDKDTKERNLLSALHDYTIDFKERFPGNNDSETNKKVWEDCCDVFLMCKYILNNRIKTD